MGAFIFAAQKERSFLVEHGEKWLRGIRRFVLKYLLDTNEETLKAYILFLTDAAQYLPPVCRPMLQQLHIWLPVIFSFESGDPTVRRPARELWNNMI
jgi:hypothetical protein